jgi:hypothetical protein
MDLDTLNMLMLITVCIIINIWFGMIVALMYGINNLFEFKKVRSTVKETKQ